VPRPAVPVEKVLARQLQTATRRERAAQEKAEQARDVLAYSLQEAREEGYSVQALSLASGLSPKRVRILLRGVESG